MILVILIVLAFAGWFWDIQGDCKTTEVVNPNYWRSSCEWTDGSPEPRTIVKTVEFRKWFWPTLGLSSFMTFLTACGLALVWIGVCALAMGVQPAQTSHWDIAVIADNSAINGQFSLFGGVVNTTPVFYYYREDGSARYLNWVEASESTVYEDSSNSYFTCTYKVLDNKWLVGPFKQTSQCHDYKFHVPAGSITTKSVLDAQ